MDGCEYVADSKTSSTSSRQGKFRLILADIGRRIANEQIAVGAYLPKEIELQEEFSASRQAVREALKVLGAKGMILARKRAGTIVCPRHQWDMLDSEVLAWHNPRSLPEYVLRDLVELRRAIEPMAARLAAARGDKFALKQVRDALDRMRTGKNSGEPMDFYSADIDFHLAVFEASGNDLVRRISTILSPLLRASFELQNLAHEPFDKGYAAHAAVYDAINVGNSQAAADAMEQLLDQARTEVFRNWQ